MKEQNGYHGLMKCEAFLLPHDQMLTVFIGTDTASRAASNMF